MMMKHNEKMEEVINANKDKIKDKNIIYPGLELTIPYGDETELSSNNNEDFADTAEKYCLKENDNLIPIFSDIIAPGSLDGLSENEKPVSEKELKSILEAAGADISGYKTAQGNSGAFLQKKLDGGVLQYFRAADDEDGRKLIQTIKKDGQFYRKVFEVKTQPNSQNENADNSEFQNKPSKKGWLTTIWDTIVKEVKDFFCGVSPAE